MMNDTSHEGVRIRVSQTRRGCCVTIAHTQCGFTLLEVMVTIGVVVFLTGLTITAATSINRKSEIRQTQATLDLLDMAAQEWQTNAGRTLTWMDYEDDNDDKAIVAVTSAEMSWKTAENLLVTEMLDVISRDPVANTILKQIDPDFMHVFESSSKPRWASPDEQSEIDERFVGSMTVVDAWSFPIYATHPGRTHLQQNFYYDQYRHRDNDGTIRTYNESRYGVAVNRRMCFVSAGPDGEFGYMSAPVDSPDFKATQDNLYSYPPATP